MTTEDNNTETSLTLGQAWSLYQSAIRATQDAVSAESAALLLCAKAAGSKTFEIDGVRKQVRERHNKKAGRKLAFVCDLERDPAEWLAEARARKVASATTTDTTTASAPLTESQPTAADVFASDPLQDPTEGMSGSIDAAGMFEDDEDDNADGTVVL